MYQKYRVIQKVRAERQHVKSHVLEQKTYFNQRYVYVVIVQYFAICHAGWKFRPPRISPEKTGLGDFWSGPKNQTSCH